MDLTGKAALVTGASSGIGQAIAWALADADLGAVGVHYRSNEEGAEETAAGLKDRGAKAHLLQADLADADQTDALAGDAETALGHVDVLVNNAGTIDTEGDGHLGHKPFEERIPEWDGVMDVNLRAPFVLTARLAPAMVDRGEGCIVNVSSVMGWYAETNTPLYNLSKAGLMQLTRQQAREYAPEVRVNCVAPGWVPTEFGWGHLGSEGFEEMISKTIPLDRMGTIDEVADLARFLVCDADYTTGAVYTVDGGIGAKVR